MKDYPVIKFTVLFVTGILVYPLVYFEQFIFAVLSLFVLIIILQYYSFKWKSKILIFPVFLLIISIGILRSSFTEKNYFLPENIYKLKDLEAFGFITKIDLIKDYELKFYLEADSIAGNSHKYQISKNDKTIKINFICRIRDTKSKLDSVYNLISPGNYISFSGTYSKGRDQRNPGEFDYNRYLKGDGISGIITTYETDNLTLLNNSFSLLPDFIFQMRKNLDEAITKLHTKRTKSLLKGLLLADKSDIDFNTRTEFINSGVIHVLAVSGLHTGFIILFLLILFGRFNIYIRSGATIAGLLLFMAVTGLPVSVFRASVMAFVIIIAFLSGRTTNLYNSLAIAALIILLVNPFEIYEPGFQLSFSAVLAIGLIFPKLNNQINSLRIKNKLVKYSLSLMAVSFSAQIGTLPFTVLYFGKLSVIAVIANLLVIPLIALIVGIAIITLLFNIFSGTIASYYATANDLFTFILFKIIKSGSDFEFSFVRIPDFSAYDSLLYILFLILLFFSFKYTSTIKARTIVFVIILFNFLIFSSLDDREYFRDGELNVLMIDVGQGDSFLVQLPCGKRLLIDAGEATFYFDNGERIIKPLLDYLRIDKIDYGIVSHLDSDHYGGFVSLVHDGRIKSIIKPPLDSLDKNDISFENFLNKMNCSFFYSDKDSICFQYSKIYFFRNDLDNSHSKNERSSVCKIVYGKNSFLFTGDAETTREKHLVKNYASCLKSDVLKVGHHGSPTSSGSEFLNIVEPKFSLISAGIENKFGHPSPEVIRKLSLKKSRIFRTDKEGAVLMRSNGDSVYVVNWREL